MEKHINHKQLVQDFNKLIEMYNYPDDLSGGMVVESVLLDAVKKGTKKACTEALLEILRYGFQSSENEIYTYDYLGYPKTISIRECDFIKYISETYLI